jgi:hypothetical protein
VLRSEEIDNASWTKTNSSVIDNTVVSPDGALTGDKFVSTSGSLGFIVQPVSQTSGTSYALSVFAKAGEYSFCQLRINTSVSAITRAYFNLSNGTLTGVANCTASIIPVGNGWYRCSIVYTATVTTANGGQRIYGQVNAADTVSDGVSGIYIWGAQLEAGAFPTSYIPTVASQVTRSADAASMTGANFSSWYRADEGAFFVEAEMYPAQSTFFRWLLSANSSSGTSGTNRVDFTVPSNSSILRFITNSGGVSSGTMQAAITLGSTFKAAGSYKTNDMGVSFNGGSALTTTTGFAPTDVNRLYIGGVADSGVGFNSSIRIKKIAYYPKRLANSELAALTQN